MLQPEEVTNLLKAMSAGESQAPEKLLPIVYEDLRRLAGVYLSNERTDHTLQATALVHEAYIRLVDWQNVSWQNRAHFFAVAAQVMRRILVDHARRKKAEKRGGFGRRLALDDAVSFPEKKDVDLVALDDALELLEKSDARQAKIVELRFFGGLTIEETAEVLKISPATVKNEWTFAKAWLRVELTKH
ncbi:MAG: sigma-70 family RNA polymerase sigma factor [Acidobacteriota bacterium]|nr:sigma-70 family RNA polymerase sigma factor [Acidobacteriota bacterium]